MKQGGRPNPLLLIPNELSAMRLPCPCNQEGRQERPSDHQDKTGVIGRKIIDPDAVFHCAMPIVIKDPPNGRLQNQWSKHDAHVAYAGNGPGKRRRDGLFHKGETENHGTRGKSHYADENHQYPDGQVGDKEGEGPPGVCNKATQ